MIKTIRKNALVRYTGSNPLMNGKTYKVIKKTGSTILIYYPLRYASGNIYLDLGGFPISEFELITK